MTNEKNIFSTALLFFLISTNSFSQDSTSITRDSIPQKDFIDVLHSIFKHKKNIADTTTNRKDKKYQFSILPGLGYTLQSSFVANVSGNLVYRNGEISTTNLSSFIGALSYTAKKQLLFYIQSDIFTENDKWNFTGDLRFYKYPQNTYGLGGFTKEEDATLVNYSFLRFYETAFRKIKKDVYLGVGLMLDKRWNITEEKKNTKTDFDLYGYKTELISSGISLNLLTDTRDNPINALKGFYASVVFRQNTTMLGSNENWSSLLVDLRKYYSLDNKKTVLGFWSYNWFTINGKTPYLDLPSTSWDTYNNMGRGYIQSRFRSPNLIYLESELRFNISRNQLFGGVLFANTQTYTEINSNKFEKILPAFGTGIRLKFNKRSRTNLALDYAIGLNGSGGIFVNLGEVF